MVTVFKALQDDQGQWIELSPFFGNPFVTEVPVLRGAEETMEDIANRFPEANLRGTKLVNIEITVKE